MDALLVALQNVCEQLLPILGAVALVFLCILLKKAWGLVEQLTKTVDSLSPTIHGVDQSIEKLQAPLDTAVRLSHTVDDVHDKTSAAIEKGAEFVSDNIGNIKDFVTDKLNKNNSVEDYEEDDE